MKIILSDSYYARCTDTLLGYEGEHNARTITFDNLPVSGADRYRMRFEYSDGAAYEGVE